jgi:hypothetical protein
MNITETAHSGDASTVAPAGPPVTRWALDDADLPLDVLGARICAMATRMAQATFHWLQMIAEFDRREGWSGIGIRSCAHWLSWTCSMASVTAREHVRVARALQDLPLVCAEMSEGRLSYAKVREITRVSDRVDEATLVDLARTATASQLARTVRGFRAADGTRGTQEQNSHVRWTVGDDGCVSFSARLPPDEGAVVVAAMEAARDDLIRQSGRDPDAVPGCPNGAMSGQAAAGGDAASGGHARSDGGDAASGDPGAEQQPRTPINPVDVMLQWARGYLSAVPQDRSGEDRTMVVVHVNAEHLIPDQQADADQATDTDTDTPAGRPAPRPATAPRSRGNAEPDTGDRAGSTAPDGPIDRSAIPVDCCQIAGVGSITRATAARLACDATLIGIVRGAGGTVLAHGRKRRLVSPAQRRLLTVRDGGCRFPSCIRTSHLEAHHVRHWAHGGATDPDNLILLCRFHHIACHEAGVMISYAQDSIPGAPRWHFTTHHGDAMLGDRLPTGAPGWRDDQWILWRALDGTDGWNDQEAERIRPRWAGERFSLADAVGVLFERLREPENSDDDENLLAA